MQTQKQTLALQQRLQEAKGIDLEMLEALKGKILYVHEGDTNTPFSGRLESFGETFLKLVDVTLFNAHYSLPQLDRMRRSLEPDSAFRVTKVPNPVYKNRTDIATLVELYPEPKFVPEG